MKNLFSLALIKSVRIIHEESGKFLCQILSATNAKSPRPSVVTMDDYFTTNHQLALYLHRSDSCTTKYRLQGYIPYINEGGSILVKKSDVDKAVKLYPQLIASSPVPSRPAPRIYARLIRDDDGNNIVHFTHQGRECFISVASGMPVDRAIIYSYCRKFIQIVHRVKPFKIAPDLSKIAA
jgi:hypothetical protein